MQESLERFWFQPYIPFLFLFLIGFLLYKFAYPAFQSAIKPNLITNLATPTPSDNGDPERVVSKVSALIELPQDEKPEVVKITDVEKFKDQPFFKKAKNGDTLLLYQKSKKAILYDPLNGKILDVAPITDPEEQAKQLAQYCQAIATQSAALAPSDQILATQSAQATSPFTKTITYKEDEVGFLVVRESPSSNAAQVGEVSPGKTFAVLDEREGWFKIEFEEGKFGWVSSAFVVVN